MLKKILSFWKFHLFPFLCAYLAKGTLRLILKTCRYELKGIQQFQMLASKHRTILAIWHNQLAIIPEFLNAYVPSLTFSAVVSNSADGKILDIIANSYRRGRSIKVGHKSRFEALQKIIVNLKSKNEIVVITPDGPKGPLYCVKPGIIIAAQESDAIITPLSWTSERCWEVSTWDRLKIPKPFSKICLEIGHPIKELPTNMKDATAKVEHALLSLMT